MVMLSTYSGEYNYQYVSVRARTAVFGRLWTQSSVVYRQGSGVSLGINFLAALQKRETPQRLPIPHAQAVRDPLGVRETVGIGHRPRVVTLAATTTLSSEPSASFSVNPSDPVRYPSSRSRCQSYCCNPAHIQPPYLDGENLFFSTSHRKCYDYRHSCCL
jgi:hypothetical protein